nr:DUF4157 domain-containing protein [Streptomyces mashuensis]
MLRPAGRRPGVQDVLRGPGRPLPVPLREEMEARLGADFSGVRLHTDAAARGSAEELGARAYTAGQHIVVGAGGADRHTLAHELIHVMQQRSGPVAGTDRGDGTRVSDPGDRFERAAESGARSALSGRVPPGAVPAPAAAGSTRGGPVVQRMKFYRGLSEADADALVARRGAAGRGQAPPEQRPEHTGRLEPTGGGEFGKGVYFWEEDREAALLSALQYQAQFRNWAVVAYDVPDELLRQKAAEARAGGQDWVSFPDDADTRPSEYVPMRTDEPRPYENFTEEQIAAGRHPHPLIEHPVAGGAWGRKKDGTPVTAVAMNVQWFRQANSDPERRGLPGMPPDGIEWTKYPFVAGMSVADYSKNGPRQARFLGAGIDLLNHGEGVTITKVLRGKQATQNDVSWLRRLTMDDRPAVEKEARRRKLLS